MKVFKIWLVLAIFAGTLVVSLLYGFGRFTHNVATELDSISTELNQIQKELDDANSILTKDMVFDSEEFASDRVTKTKMYNFTKDGVKCFQLTWNCDTCVGDEWCIKSKDPFAEKLCFKIMDIKDEYFQYMTLRNKMLWSRSFYDFAQEYNREMFVISK